MEQSSFKITADILLKNAAKSSVRDLNAEFQRMGGKVIHKSSKHGSVYLLSHPDDAYLEQFRIRLFKELGLIEEKEIPKEVKTEPVQAPRYGETHRLRKGWNVRSEKEIKEGITDDAVADPWKKKPEPKKERKEAEPDIEDYDEDEPPAEGRTDDEEEPEIKTYEERWGKIDDLLTIVEEALKAGAVDDGQIIKFAYNKELPEQFIKKLKKQLWDNRCRGLREECPFKKKKYKFEDLMRLVHGKVEGHERIDSPLKRFEDLWARNIEEMYGPFRDRDVEVLGKISSFKPQYKKGKEHVKLLLYDLRMNVQGDEKVKDARKIWVRIDLKDYHDLTRDITLRIEDIIKLKGKCILDPFFHDHWVVEVNYLDKVREGRGEALNVMK